MALEQTVARTTMQGWIDRLVGSEREIQRMATNQHDLKGIVEGANSTSSFAVDQWNRSTKNEGFAGRDPWLHRYWNRLQTAVDALDRTAEKPAEVGDIAKIAMEPTADAMENDIKGRVIGNMQQLDRLSTKQRGLRGMIDKLKADSTFEVDQWDATTRYHGAEGRARTLESYWDTLRAQMFTLGKEV